jgi:hypothetical protein
MRSGPTQNPGTDLVMRYEAKPHPGHRMIFSHHICQPPAQRRRTIAWVFAKAGPPIVLAAFLTLISSGSSGHCPAQRSER